MEDLSYEDLGEANLPEVMSLPDLSVSPSQMEIGRWGEEWVYRFLLHTCQDAIKVNAVEVTWMNEKEESSSPYDILMRQNCTPPQDIYIEVKSTGSEKKDLFEVSMPQIHMAHKYRHAYQIYRVYNAGSAGQAVRLKVLSEVAAMLDIKAVKLYMMM